MAILVANLSLLSAQEISPTYTTEARELAAHPQIMEAFALAEELDQWSLERLIELTEIPAPPFLEEARGQRFAQLLEQLGADSVWTDTEGNVIGLRRGRSGERTIGFGGHLDTVFPEGTDVTVRQVGDTLFAPGIGDDTRGLVVVLTALRAMEEAGVETEDDVLFVGVVGEEGLGDLRGMKHLFREPNEAPDVWIDVDGGGLSRLVTMGLGSVRYRTAFNGPGGHSWGAFGLVNPAHAMSRGVNEENRLRRSGPPLTLENRKGGDRPSGSLESSLPLIQRALATTAVFGVSGELARSSTDSNVPIALGVPAVTIGRGGIGGEGHSPGEWWINRDGHLAIQRALLLVVAEAGLANPIS